MARSRPQRRLAKSVAQASRRADPTGTPASGAPLALATLIAAACLIVSVSFVLYDTDAWQHLLVGKAILGLGHVPITEVWTWPNHGAPNVNLSWGFSVLVWPFWSVGGVAGLYVWRWATTLAAFALLWQVARVVGARGLAVPLVLVIAGLVYRQRVQIRPETLAGIWLALTMLVLEWRLHGRDRTVWLIPLACVWVNTHISFYLLFVLLGIHLVAAHAGREPGLRRLWIVTGACVLVTLVNPFGWNGAMRPLEFFAWRSEPFFRNISEIGPIVWSQNWSNGLPLLLAGWPLLAWWRGKHGPVDRVEWLMLGVFTVLGLSSSRFVATYVLVAAPFVARDLAEWCAAWRIGASGTWSRAIAASVAMVALCAWDWTHNVGPLGIHFDMSRAPVHACDFMERHAVRGRGFNHFQLGGYELWRFWPEGDRLPFMDIHPEDATREARDLYVAAMTTSDGWQQLDRRFHFDYALVTRRFADRPGLLDVIDDDPAWALVFVDDVAALYVRREGTMAAVADRHAYSTLGGSRATIPARLQHAAADTAFRATLRDELERQAGESPVNFYGRSMMRALDAMVGQGETR
jgi:hypothetical protein